MLSNVVTLSSARARIADRASQGPRALVRAYSAAWKAGDLDRAGWLFQDGVARFGSAPVIAAFTQQMIERIEAALPHCPNETVHDHRQRLISAIQAELEQIGVRNAAEKARRYVEEYRA